MRERKIDPDDPGQVVWVMADCLNTVNDDEVVKQLVEAMSRQHRTLQQNFTRFVVAWIKDLAKRDSGQYDLRNEASVMLAKKIVEKVGEDNLFLPTI